MFRLSIRSDLILFLLLLFYSLFILHRSQLIQLLPAWFIQSDLSIRYWIVDERNMEHCTSSLLCKRAYLIENWLAYRQSNTIPFSPVDEIKIDEIIRPFLVPTPLSTYLHIPSSSRYSVTTCGKSIVERFTLVQRPSLRPSLDLRRNWKMEKRKS